MAPCPSSHLPTQLLPSFCPWPSSLSQHSLPWRSYHTPDFCAHFCEWFPGPHLQSCSHTRPTACWMPRKNLHTSEAKLIDSSINLFCLLSLFLITVPTPPNHQSLNPMCHLGGTSSVSPPQKPSPRKPAPLLELLPTPPLQIPPTPTYSNSHYSHLDDHGGSCLCPDIQTSFLNPSPITVAKEIFSPPRPYYLFPLSVTSSLRHHLLK